jgi:hypothetical protein
MKSLTFACLCLLAAVVRADAAQTGRTRKAAPAAAGSGAVARPPDYWRRFRTDIIRQIFDGGFGVDVDDGDEFKLLFNTYVEAFSSNCRAYLPANRQSIEVRQVRTRTDRTGAVTERETLVQGTVQADPRFAAKYRQYGEYLTSAQHGLTTVLRTRGRGLGDTTDPALDAFQFFKTETCDSAAMKQLGENLLRGATGAPSLQQASASAGPGGAAGGFTHIVDACNAYYRSGRYAPIDPNAYCKCLGEQFSAVLSPQEEASIAADFENNVRYNILQPKGDHPLWGRLHERGRSCAR